jgi:hypothetical protein
VLLIHPLLHLQYHYCCGLESHRPQKLEELGYSMLSFLGLVVLLRQEVHQILAFYLLLELIDRWSQLS